MDAVYDGELEGCRTGRIHRTGGLQDRRDERKKGVRICGMQNMQVECSTGGTRVQNRRNAEQERCMKGGIRD